MRAHNDSSTMRISADELFVEGELPHDVLKLRNRCLQPGLYAKHLERWLDHFPIHQFIFVDGKALREDPATILDGVVGRLGLPALDYRRLLKFDPVKGFFCVEGARSRKCLGSGKGRKYSPMSAQLRLVLNKRFEEPNAALRALLAHYNIELPYFLRGDL